MVDKYYQTIHGGITKHDPRKLAQTKGLAREFGDLVNDYDDRGNIYERRVNSCPLWVEEKHTEGKNSGCTRESEGPPRIF